MTTYTLNDVRKMGDGTSYSFEDLQAMQPSFMDDVAQQGKNLLGGSFRGAGSIGATILSPIDMAAKSMGIKNQFIGMDDRRSKMDEGIKSMGANPNSFLFGAGKLGTEIAGTVGVGGLMGNAIKKIAPSASSLINSISTSGMRTGIAPGISDMITRIIGGAATGGASAGIVNPEEASIGSLIGGSLPLAVSSMGKLGSAISSKLGTPAIPEKLLESAKKARNEGYVIPPSQVKPTFVNRMLEGFSGKITTAQNASAKNISITNNLAQKGIGADELSEKGIQRVRDAANETYKQLGQVGRFETDNLFRDAVQKAGDSSSKMKKDFPNLVNPEIDNLVADLSLIDGFDSQSAIEAIKQYRFNGSGNKISTDPAKKMLGRAQMKIANAIEDVIDRNLEKSGSQDLLNNYRSARQTLAKVYDVEKAMNSATGNVDAAYLGKLLDKGRLTDELKTIGEFAKRFPKAVQSVEKMGSLPQVSPLDFGALATMGAITSNPYLLAGVVARPAARSLVLSNLVQNGLTNQVGNNGISKFLSNPQTQQFFYRSSPNLWASQ